MDDFTAIGCADRMNFERPGSSPPIDPTDRLLTNGLAAGRIAIGAGLWLAPRLSARALGFREVDDRLLAIGRLAATRDLALGAWQLAARSDREALRKVTATVAAVDAADAFTFALALRGETTRIAGLRGLPVAAAAALAGAWLAARG
jgi:hypothetical protein